MPNRRTAGYTLIEIMIVVVILGIVAAIAWPAYTSQTQKSRRGDAIRALTIAVTQLERCQSDSGTYVGCAFTAASPNGNYNVTVARTADTFTLTATPVAGGRQASDADCTTLTINNLGQKGYTGAAPKLKRCWTE